MAEEKKAKEKKISFTEAEEKALMDIMNRAVKATGTDDGGLTINNVMHVREKFK